MISFLWNGYEFKIVQYGAGVFRKDMTGHSHSKNSYELHYITNGKKTNDTLVSAFLSTHFYFGKNEEFQKYFEMILQEKEKRKLGYSSAIVALMQLLLTEIARIYLAESNDITQDNINLNDMRFLIIESAFIDNPENLTLAALSESLGLCERQTQRLLKKYYSKSFSEKKEESIKRHDI